MSSMTAIRQPILPNFSTSVPSPVHARVSFASPRGSERTPLDLLWSGVKIQVGVAQCGSKAIGSLWGK